MFASQRWLHLLHTFYQLQIKAFPLRIAQRNTDLGAKFSLHLLNRGALRNFKSYNTWQSHHTGFQIVRTARTRVQGLKANP